MLYATPMVALVPFILSMMGFGFAPKVLVVFLFAVPRALQHGGRRTQHQPELVEVAHSSAREWPLWRTDHSFYPAIHDDRDPAGDARGLVGMIVRIFPELVGSARMIMTGSQNSILPP